MRSSLLKNTPLQTFILLLIAMLFHDVLPQSALAGSYTFSIIIKDCLMIVLPVALFFFIASSLMHFEKKGLLLVFMILVFEAVSNTTASTAAYGLSFLGQGFLSSTVVFHPTQALESLFSLDAYKPSWWRMEWGILLGVIAGLFIPYLKNQYMHSLIFRGRDVAVLVFSKGFARIIPLFVLGFFLNLLNSKGIGSVLSDSLPLILFMTSGLSLYIFGIFLIAAGGVPGAFVMLKNAFPAGLTAFSTMSSAATMPITIAVTEKNLIQKDFAKLLIPATVNIQQVGDCFAQVFLCCMILCFFGKGMPDVSTFFTFLIVFIFARYTTSGMIGGAIFIMIPIYQSYLGFNAEMTTLLLGFNMVLDPIITSTNVMANSGLCVVFEKVWIGVTGKLTREDVPYPSQSLNTPTVIDPVVYEKKTCEIITHRKVI